MTEAQLIHEGWLFWEAPTIYLGTQWSYEEKQAMRAQRCKPVRINRAPKALEDLKRAHFKAWAIR